MGYIWAMYYIYLLILTDYFRFRSGTRRITRRVPG